MLSGVRSLVLEIAHDMASLVLPVGGAGGWGLVALPVGIVVFAAEKDGESSTVVKGCVVFRFGAQVNNVTSLVGARASRFLQGTACCVGCVL